MMMAPEEIAAWTAVIAAAAAGGLELRRRASRNSVDVAADGAERDALRRLLAELDTTRADLAQRDAAARLAGANLARAEAEKIALKREVENLGDEFAAFQRKMGRLFPVTREFMDSNVMPLDDHQ